MSRDNSPITRPGKFDRDRASTKFAVVSVQDNSLTCNPFNGDGTVNTNETRYVMKPYSLWRTPFDGKTVAGISYAYSSGSERVATGSVVETHVITPDYWVDADTPCIIYASLITPKLQLADGNVGTGQSTAWMDDNRDARAWAVQ